MVAEHLQAHRLLPGDGALWFTETAADRIGRLTTDGTVTGYPLPRTGAFPSAIAAAGDAMWFTMNQANAVGRIGMDGRITVHELPTEAAAPVGIAAGPDGSVGFTEIAAGQIGRRAPDGRITEYPLPDRGCGCSGPRRPYSRSPRGVSSSARWPTVRTSSP